MADLASISIEDLLRGTAPAAACPSSQLSGNDQGMEEDNMESVSEIDKMRIVHCGWKCCYPNRL